MGLILYYAIASWFLHRQVRPGPLVLHTQPPANMLPGPMRYVLTWRYDKRAFAADLAEMSLRGMLVLISADGRWRTRCLMTFADKTNNTLPEIYRYAAAAIPGTMPRAICWRERVPLRQLRRRLRDYCTTVSSDTRACFAWHAPYAIVGVVLACLMCAGGYLLLDLTPEFAGVVGLCALICVVGTYGLRTYSPAGRALADHIVGYQMHMRAHVHDYRTSAAVALSISFRPALCYHTMCFFAHVHAPVAQLDRATDS